MNLNESNYVESGLIYIQNENMFTSNAHALEVIHDRLNSIYNKFIFEKLRLLDMDRYMHKHKVHR